MMVFMSAVPDPEGDRNWADRYRAVHDALGEVSPVRDEIVAALRLLPALRDDLDGVERAAIDAARRCGVGWAEIASTLGLRSRQAAEQRRLRLGSPDAGRDAAGARRRRQRQQSVDTAAGKRIVDLRLAVRDLAAGLDRAAGPERGEPAVVLARRTLRVALDADPGALVDLARLAIADLARVTGTAVGAETGAGVGGRPVHDAVRRIRELVDPEH
jgi:hypothetical protein